MTKKRDTKRTSVQQPIRHLNFGEGSYLESTSRPLYALFFLLPLVIFYEVGTIWVNTEQIHQNLSQIRIVAFIWLMNLAEWIGMHRSLAWAFPGFVVIIILLCWHLAGKQSWRVRPGWLGWMAFESVLLSLPLLILSASLGSSINASAAAAVSFTANGTVSNYYLAELVTSIGAGIYEELVFRLILIGLILMILEDVLKIKRNTATVIAVLASAILFGAHHYIGIEGGHFIDMPDEMFTWVSFLFRTAAGIYFAVLFRYRGYGITAGAHASYNIILNTFWC